MVAGSRRTESSTSLSPIFLLHSSRAGNDMARRGERSAQPVPGDRGNSRLTTALNTNADQLIFDNTETGPENGEWHLRLEAITHLDPDEQAAIRTVIDGILLRHQARKIAS